MTKRRLVLAAVVLSLCGCATDGTVSGGAGIYGDWYYMDDIWYGGGCCVDPPANIGAHPEHPIVIPPEGIGPPRVENPIALPDAQPKRANTTPSASSSASRSAAPRMSSMPRGGGGRGGGRR